MSGRWKQVIHYGHSRVFLFKQEFPMVNFIALNLKQALIILPTLKY